MAALENEVIWIKPHHFLDIIRDIGAGRVWEPHPYGHAVHSVGRELLADRDRMLELVVGIDDICRPCRYNINGVCTDTTESPGYEVSKDEWNRTIDGRWLERLGLAEGDRVTARELCRLAGDNMGDIFTIYREADRKKTGDRERALKRGITLFLK